MPDTAEQTLIEVIEKFMPDAEVRDVGMYVVFRNHLLQMAERAVDLDQVEVTNVAPEQLKMAMSYDSGLVNNKFYIENFAVIKALISMDELILHSRGFHLRNAKDDAHSRQVVRDLLPNRFCGLSTIVMLKYGMDRAKAFDVAMRSIITLTDDELEFMRQHGVA